MPSARRAVELKRWLEFPENMFQIATAFNSTSRFARLSSLKINIAGCDFSGLFLFISGKF
jgi:hydroxymethylglutaryl-CoA reductase (NADPH)